jgi:hypothetical protein
MRIGYISACPGLISSGDFILVRLLPVIIHPNHGRTGESERDMISYVLAAHHGVLKIGKKAGFGHVNCITAVLPMLNFVPDTPKVLYLVPHNSSLPPVRLRVSYHISR